MIPLQGIRVLDLMEANGYCGMELADHGAEVIKIESPLGDILRQQPPLKNGGSIAHAFQNRGKKSFTLNLHDPADRLIFKKLVATTDVLLENFPPGTMEEWALDFSILSDIQPALVYGRILADGTYTVPADMPASEILSQAKTGVMHVTGFPKNPPTRIGFAIAHRYAASFLAAGVCAALFYARRSGVGQIVETTLTGSLVAITEDKVLTWGVTGEDPMRTGNAHPLINPYDVLKCQDGYVALGIASDNQWSKFCDAFNRPQWKTDSRYCSNEMRGIHYFSDLRPKIEKLFTHYTMQEITNICDSVLFPGCMCSTTAEALSEPQLQARNMLTPVHDPLLGELHMPGRPVKFPTVCEPALQAAPLLGEHNAAIRSELGINEKCCLISGKQKKSES